MLKDKTESNVKFLTIKDKSIVEESKFPIEGFEVYEVINPSTKETVTKFIKRYGSVSGKIIDAEFRKIEVAPKKIVNSIRLKLIDEGLDEYYFLTIPFPSRFADSFLKVCENIDVSKPVEIGIFSSGDGIFFKQDNEIVRRKYTRDNPGDLPQAVYNSVLGKWDFSEQQGFLVKKFTEEFIPKVRNQSPVQTDIQEVEEKIVEEKIEDEEGESLEDLIKSIKKERKANKASK
jgi:hypothetical protein